MTTSAAALAEYRNLTLDMLNAKAHWQARALRAEASLAQMAKDESCIVEMLDERSDGENRFVRMGPEARGLLEMFFWFGACAGKAAGFDEVAYARWNTLPLYINDALRIVAG